MPQETIDPLAVRVVCEAFADQLTGVTDEQRQLFADAIEASALEIRASGKPRFYIPATRLTTAYPAAERSSAYVPDGVVAAAAEAAGITFASVPQHSGIWLDATYAVVGAESVDSPHQKTVVWRHATLPMPRCSCRSMSIADAYPNMTSGDTTVDHLPDDREQCVLEVFHGGQCQFPPRTLRSLASS